jgi:hypothetical protein
VLRDLKWCVLRGDGGACSAKVICTQRGRVNCAERVTTAPALQPCSPPPAHEVAVTKLQPPPSISAHSSGRLGMRAAHALLPSPYHTPP